MNNIALNILAAAVSVVLDKHGLISPGCALRVSEWMASDAFCEKYDDACKRSLEGLAFMGEHLGDPDPVVPNPGIDNTGSIDNEVCASLANILFWLRVPDDIHHEWMDVIIEVTSELVGNENARHICENGLLP